MSPDCILVEVRELALDKGAAVAISQNDYATGKPLIAAFAPKGFVMCGLLDVGAAERLGMAAVRVLGVASIEELLEREVVQVTSRARELGIKEGMKGKEALEKLS
ncbi:MAG: YunC family protein [Thaumarchaeota archaeon]|nr:YunC family protein [Nitrososphaerota archaeon]